MDAIVVRYQEETGIECMRHLRRAHWKCHVSSLDTIGNHPTRSQERVQYPAARDTRFHLATDVITCEDAFRPAVHTR
jgi:hypothetical protein